MRAAGTLGFWHKLCILLTFDLRLRQGRQADDTHRLLLTTAAASSPLDDEAEAGDEADDGAAAAPGFGSS